MLMHDNFDLRTDVDECDCARTQRDFDLAANRSDYHF